MRPGRHIRAFVGSWDLDINLADYGRWARQNPDVFASQFGQVLRFAAKHTNSVRRQSSESTNLPALNP